MYKISSSSRTEKDSDDLDSDISLYTSFECQVKRTSNLESALSVTVHRITVVNCSELGVTIIQQFCHLGPFTYPLSSSLSVDHDQTKLTDTLNPNKFKNCELEPFFIEIELSSHKIF